MKQKNLSLAIIGILLLGGIFVAFSLMSTVATADATAIAAANQLYNAGHYAAAAQIYEQEVARGVEDSALYYNIGNSYFQQGDVGRAVLNYQRAAQLAPRDADIQANLALARAETTELFANEASGPVTAVAQLTDWLTLNETAVVVLGFWFLLGFLIIARRHVTSSRGKSFMRAATIVAVALLLIGGISLSSRAFLGQTQPTGIVVAPSVAVSNGPGAEFVTDLSLDSGTRVNVLETQGEWARLAGPGGVGERWVPTMAVEPVASVPLAVW